MSRSELIKTLNNTIISFELKQDILSLYDSFDNQEIVEELNRIKNKLKVEEYNTLRELIIAFNNRKKVRLSHWEKDNRSKSERDDWKNPVKGTLLERSSKKN